MRLKFKIFFSLEIFLNVFSAHIVQTFNGALSIKNESLKYIALSFPHSSHLCIFDIDLCV